MTDIESNVKINIDTSDALAQLKLLQQQISVFQQAMRNAGAANAKAAASMQQNLVNSINATGQFRANIQTIKTSAESFTESLEKNKMSIGEYFRYAGGASKTFGKMFKSEFATIQQVAEERVKTLQTQFIKLGRDANGAMKAISVRPLALDMDDLGTKTQLAAQRQQLFNQLMKQGSTQLLNFGKNTQWAGRQLMVGFTVPLMMMGSAAAKAYMQIEQASVKFKRVYGDMNTTTAETNKMVKQVQNLANEFTKYGVAVADTMDMAAQAAAMGKTGTDLLAQINQAAKLSVLGGVDQNKALETTISLTNAFGVASKDLASNIDFLNAVENQTVLSIDDMTTAIPKAAPVVKQLGGNVKDLAFFLTAMKEGGVNASEGANALKSGLASMINPTKKASDFLAGFGINIKGIVEGDKGNLRKTVIDFASALNTLDPLNRARAIEMMFGKFQFSRISTLFKNVIDQGSQANKVAGLANDTAEELAILSEREMKKVSDSPMYKFQKSIQDMQAKLAPVGEAFLKAVTPIVEFVSKILDGFNNLSDGAKGFITMLTTAVAGIGPLLLMSFGLVSNGIANIMKLFTNIKGFINKTTKPSDVLGEQTQYMTTEQLKGAAIASSLDQAHAKLRQTFTAEAQAVDKLTAAYQRSIAAQGAYSGVPGVPIAGKPPKKYANGVAVVPGPRGAGDIVPALLSPGEAVIPAKHTEKYAPLISGMVAGNLPGFAGGTPKVNPLYRAIGAQESHLQGAMDANDPKVFAQLKKVYGPNIKPQDFKNFEILGNLTMTLPGIINQRLKSGGMPSRDFLAAYNSLHGKLSKTALRSGVKDMLLSQQLEDMIGVEAARSAIVTDPSLSGATRIALGNAINGKSIQLAGAAASILARGGQVGTVRSKLGDMPGSATDVLLTMLKNQEIMFDGSRQLVTPFGARIGRFNFDPFGSGKPGASKDEKVVRENAQKAADAWIAAGNWNAPLPMIIGTNGKPIRLSLRSNSGRPGEFGKALGNISYDQNKTGFEGSLGLTSGNSADILRSILGISMTGYANGVFSVPGPKGAGDVVPAMLSPGEAVIPADKAAQHRPLISAMIGGKLPGYEGGTPSVPGAPVPLGPSETPQAQVSLFHRIGKSLTDAAEKSGKKLLTAADQAAAKLVAKHLTGNKTLITDSKGNVVNQKEFDAQKLADQKEEELRIARLERTREHLKANDEEYAQLQRETDIYRKERDAGVQHTKEQQAQQAARTRKMYAMENGQIAEWDANGGKGEPGVKKKGLGGFFTRSRGTGNALGAAYGISTAMGMLSMAPGQVGQTAQSLMGPVGAATAAMSMIPGPAGLVAGGLAALVVGAIQLNEHFKEVSKQSAELERQMGTSNSAIAKFAEFSKKVSGTEVMDKRRAGSAGQFFNVVQGKTTFGESYMKSDAGKALVKSVDTEISKGGGLKNAEKLITNQLSEAIASGVMTPAQARSIAANLGTQLGDANFGLSVTANLTDIMGPNGENLKNQPLQVSMKIINSSMDQVNKNSEALQKTTGAGELANQAGKSLGYGAVGAGAGLAAGGIVAGLAGAASSAGLALAAEGTLVGALAAAGSAVPVIGTIAGAITGLVIVGVQYQEQITKQAAALSESISNTLQVEQQMVDSLQVAYEKRIAEAKAAGDTAEAIRLQNQYMKDQQALLEANKQTNIALFKQIDKQSEGFLGIGNAKQAMSDTVNQSIEDAYKGSGMEMQAKMAREAVDNSAGSLSQEILVKQAMATKQLGIDQANTAMSIFGGSQGGMNKLTKLLESSPVEANRTLGLAGQISNAGLRNQFATQMTGMDPAKLVQMNNALELANKTRGVFTGKANQSILKFSVQNEDKMLKFAANIEKLKAQKVITVDIATKMIGKDALGAIKSKFAQFNKYNKENKVVFLTELQQIMAMKGDKDMIASFKVWRNEQGNPALTFADYAAFQADRTVTTQGVDNTTGTGTGTGTGTKTGPTASILDPYVQSLREASNWQQKLTVGWSASYNALKKYSTKAIQAMAGNAIIMREAGADQNFLQAFLGGTEAEQNKIIDKATGKITKAGRFLIAQTKKIEQAKIGMAYVVASESERLQKDNELYQAGLDVIAAKEKKINDKYDTRIKALDEIGKLQDKNNQKEQDALDIADALSKGDIAAAARAAMKMRQDDQRQALEDSKNAVENARKDELGSVTTDILGQSRHRSDLEKLIADNAERIAIAKKNELDKQIEIGKHALKVADQMAKTLKSAKGLVGLKVPKDTGGGSNTNTGSDQGTGGNQGTDKGTDKGGSKTTAQVIKAMKGSVGNLGQFAGQYGSVIQGITSGSTKKQAMQSALNRKSGAIFDIKNMMGTGGNAWIGTEIQNQGKISSTMRKKINAIRANMSKTDRTKLDTLLANYDTAVKDVQTADEMTTETQAATALSQLPQAIQDAFTKLASFKDSRDTLSQAVADANDALKAFAGRSGTNSNNWTPTEIKERKTLLENRTKAQTALTTFDNKNVNPIWNVLKAKGYGLPTRKLFSGYSQGGMVYASNGLEIAASKYALGTDTIPAMLTPGEFVMSKPAVDRIGAGKLSGMNNGDSSGESVYNYSITVNATGNFDANDLAKRVIQEIKRVDSQRIRSNNY